MERPSIQTPGTDRQMSCVDYVDHTRAMVARLEERERLRTPDKAQARQRLADRLRTLPGTLENLALNRLKRVDAFFEARVRRLLIIETQREIEALTHELEALRRMGADPRSPAIFEALAALETARALMRGAA